MVNYSDCVFTEYDSSLGAILLAADEAALTGVWFVGQKHSPETIGIKYGENEPLIAAAAWLNRYFAGENPPIDFPLHPRGSEYQRQVWELLREIPYGESVTYGTLANRLTQKRGYRTSARAIGNAVGRNPISILIPCHRVIGADGSLTGYAGGIERKTALLSLEQVGGAECFRGLPSFHNSQS